MEKFIETCNNFYAWYTKLWIDKQLWIDDLPYPVMSVISILMGGFAIITLIWSVAALIDCKLTEVDEKEE